jgi:hypothetical protein
MMNQTANPNQRKAEIFPVMEKTATMTGYFAWHFKPETVSTSYGRILSPAVSAGNSKLNTLEN